MPNTHIVRANSKIKPKFSLINIYFRNKDAGYEYDSDYMGPRKPYMREDRSTSPPDHDPIFRRAHQRSVGVQETQIFPPIHKKVEKKSRSKSKKKSPQKIKFSQNFLKKYPALFRGLKTNTAKKAKKEGVITVVYKPWIPSSGKYSYFDEIAHKYKVY